MVAENQPILRFNAGRLSPKALARMDLKRYSFAAEEMTNWLPDQIGSMSLRPGLQYLGPTYFNRKARFLPFVYATDDTALIELTDGIMRVWVNDVAVTVPSVSSAVTNSDFDTNLSGWTDADESGCVSAWATGGFMSLTGLGASQAIRQQQIVVAGADQNVRHFMDLKIARGEVVFKIGSTLGGEEYLTEQRLTAGRHILSFVPTGTFYISVAASTSYATLVDWVRVASAGSMVLSTPWAEADLPLVRMEQAQSGDVIFVACAGVKPMRIERRGTYSWSLVDYLSEDGPFRIPNFSDITIQPSAKTGDITLTASRALFSSAHVGALFKLTHQGQNTGINISAGGQWTDEVRVTGVDAMRDFTYIVSGTFVATVTLQRSFDEGATWEDVLTATAPTGSVVYADSTLYNNQIVHYRLGVDTGDFTSGAVYCSIVYTRGTRTGIARVVSYSSSTVVSAVVLSAFSADAATSTWSEGLWSGYRGHPSAVALHEGRLVWAGGDKVVGSVADAFASFDEDLEGNSAPYSRSIGTGPVDRIAWLCSLLQLVLGGQGGEHVAMADTLGTPLTATNFSVRTPSTQGSADVEAEKLDDSAVFVQRARRRVYRLKRDSSVDTPAAEDLTPLCPEFGDSPFNGIAISQQPDTRIFLTRDDGTVGLIVFSKPEFQDINCLCDLETDGAVEDVTVLPSSDGGESVYMLVKRVVGGSDVRYLEKLASERDCVGGALNKQADSFVAYTGTATTTVTAAHLAGRQVVVWADGADKGTFTLNGSGQATLSAAVTTYVVGLPYTARFKSFKLGHSAQFGTVLNQRQRVARIGLLLRNTHAKGLRYGADFDTLDDMPDVERGTSVATGYLWDSYAEDSFSFNGEWTTDCRVCLEASAPRPCEVLSVTVSLETVGRG